MSEIEVINDHIKVTIRRKNSLLKPKIKLLNGEMEACTHTTNILYEDYDTILDVAIRIMENTLSIYEIYLYRENTDKIFWHLNIREYPIEKYIKKD